MPNVRCIRETLTLLRLNNNRITHINSSALHCLTALKYLYLQNNLLEYIAYNALCETPLNLVNLQNNSLTSTPNFSCIYNEIQINIFNNTIQEIPPDSFTAVMLGDWLHLGNNTLSNVTSLGSILSGEQVDLGHNNLTCFKVVSILTCQYLHV